MATKFGVTPPDLNACKTYEAFKREITAWASVTDLAKSKQGNYVALSLPNKSQFGNDLRERVFENLSPGILSADDGLQKVIDFLDKELGKDAIDDVIEKWDEFDSCRKESEQSLEDFIAEYEMKQDLPIEIYFMGSTGKVYHSNSLKNLLPFLFEKKHL